MEKITNLIEKFYGDGKTAFVFTADHGMSDMGSHGDGHPDNTRTPLVAWGSGVHSPVRTKPGFATGHEDGFSQDWKLDHVMRHDVAQADIAALMAYLAGLEFPVNSVGELPLSYVASGLPEQAEAALVNAQGILEIYRVKEEQKRAKEFRYKPYAAFNHDGHAVEQQINSVRSLITHGDYENAIKSSHKLMKVGLEGLRYLQTYDWLFLRALVTIGYLGWIAFAITTVIDLHVLHGRTQPSRTIFTTGVVGAVMVAIYSFLWLRSSPITYYAYSIFPIVFWEEVVARRRSLAAGKIALLGHLKTNHDFIRLFGNLIASIALLEAIVGIVAWHLDTYAANDPLQVFSYSYRRVFTICFIAAMFWPFIYGTKFIQYHHTLIILWELTCILMNLFTLVPVLKIEDSNQMYVLAFQLPILQHNASA